MEKRVAIFDFDGTLVPVETIPFMAKSWKKHGYSHFRRLKVASKIVKDYIIFKWKINKNFGKEEFRRKVAETFLELFKGMDKKEIEKFFMKAADDIMENLNEEVVKGLNEAQESGYTTILLSGGYTPLVKEVGERLGFDHVLSSDVNFIDDKIDFHNPIEVNMGKNKLKSIEKFLEGDSFDLKGSCAYADSYYDYDILNMVGRAIAVNPDEKLERIAIDKKWEIL